VRYYLPKLYIKDDHYIEFTKKEFYMDVKNLIYFYNGTKFGKILDAEVDKTLSMREEGDLKIFKIIEEKEKQFL